MEDGSWFVKNLVVKAEAIKSKQCGGMHSKVIQTAL